jgi:hypothetical protein
MASAFPVSEAAPRAPAAETEEYTMSEFPDATPYVPAEGPTPQAILTGLGWLEAATEYGPARTGWIAAAGHTSARWRLLRAVLGASVARALVAGQPVAFSRHGQLRLVTERTLPAGGLDGPVLALLPTKRLLRRLGRLPRRRPLAVVPWARSELAAWFDGETPPAAAGPASA